MDLLRVGSTDEAPHEGCWDEAKEREKEKKERGGERGKRRRRAPFVFSTWRISETQALHRVQYYLTYSDLLHRVGSQGRKLVGYVGRELPVLWTGGGGVR